MSALFKLWICFTEHDDGYVVEKVVEEFASGKKVEHEEFLDGEVHSDKGVPKKSIAEMLGVASHYIEEC